MIGERRSHAHAERGRATIPACGVHPEFDLMGIGELDVGGREPEPATVTLYHLADEGRHGRGGKTLPVEKAPAHVDQRRPRRGARVENLAEEDGMRARPEAFSDQDFEVGADTIEDRGLRLWSGRPRETLELRAPGHRTSLGDEALVVREEVDTKVLAPIKVLVGSRGRLNADEHRWRLERYARDGVHRQGVWLFGRARRHHGDAAGKAFVHGSHEPRQVTVSDRRSGPRRRLGGRESNDFSGLTHVAHLSQSYHRPDKRVITHVYRSAWGSES